MNNKGKSEKEEENYSEGKNVEVNSQYKKVTQIEMEYHWLNWNFFFHYTDRFPIRLSVWLPILYRLTLANENEKCEFFVRKKN